MGSTRATADRLRLLTLSRHNRIPNADALPALAAGQFDLRT